VVVTAAPAQRKKAIRARKGGASQAEAARQADVCKRTIQRWEDQPDFAAQLQDGPRITLGPLPEPGGLPPAADPLDDLSASRAWLSVPGRTLLGSALPPLADPTITNNRNPDTGRPRRFTAEVAASIVQIELVSSSERAASAGMRSSSQMVFSPLSPSSASRSSTRLPLSLSSDGRSAAG